MGKRGSRDGSVSVAIVGASKGRQRIVAALELGGIDVASASDAESLVEQLQTSARDVVVVDESGGQRRAEIRLLRRALPDTPLVVVAGESSIADLRETLAEGTAGVVLEKDVATCLAMAVSLVERGQLVVPGSLRSAVSTPVLSPREKQVLAMVVMGFGNREIAQKLHVTEGTVKSHLSTAYRKLGVGSRSEATRAILDPERGLGTGILAIVGSADTPV
jgi:DNA-binding NarL/FixJ family response regulator